MRKLAGFAITESVSHQSAEVVPLLQREQQARSIRQRESLTPSLAAVLREAQRESGLSEDPSSDPGHLEKVVESAAQRLGLELIASEHQLVLSYLHDERKVFGVLQQLVDDPSISDIIVTDYSKITVQQSRRNILTDVSFASQEAYESFVERLLLNAGTTCSTKKPIADGMIGSFARIHVVHRCLCERGPYLTIRLNRFGSVAGRDLVSAGLAPLPVLNYLEAIVRLGMTVLVVGEVSTGKTTLVRALASSIPPEQSILVIEDTPEIQIEHPQVRYIRTREVNSDGAGEVSSAECIRGGMRMAMNRIVFGEMRDAKAAEAFVDVCASGHPGLSTIHARSAAEALTRLELFLGRAQRGVERSVLSEQIVTAVQVLVFIDICHRTGKRRIMQVREVGPVADGMIRQREIFAYDPQDTTPAWRVVSTISSHREQLERDEIPFSLHSLPHLIEFEPEYLLKEAHPLSGTARRAL